ncbi:transposase family protein [Micromonospora sp. NPDC050695]|uniref:transposase family protein n=1 Tax=Micromonospora sp. NPDC050695 TaxID=3154938 RepID=UPI0033E92615
MTEPWTAQQESCLHERRGRDRLRAEGADPNHDLPFTDRVIVTLVALRLQLPHAALALPYRVDRSTITRAVGEIRPLLAARGFAVPGKPGVRLRTLADVFAYAAAESVELRIDGTEVQVRCPKAGRPGRRAFVSGKKKQNTGKATVISDGKGRLLWCGAVRPGHMPDVTALRAEGIEDLLQQYPQVRAQADRPTASAGRGGGPIDVRPAGPSPRSTAALRIRSRTAGSRHGDIKTCAGRRLKGWACHDEAGAGDPWRSGSLVAAH